ncbi:MAG: kynureninase [Flavobacteriaceae bacterium CG02_land_8_20_14_3_00_34_13]|nr:kynureninase [Flavobacteriia bacterium]PIV49950.1 MAG: kynureninase [Flavobacteriaceae bacterium CG02_land_8_20_14_3_00_34_13]PJC07849.1 MAG: kynureninase [Flavobacteriaceae bacterium CG_4_9_14_0_8_um_filter_34_30]
MNTTQYKATLAYALEQDKQDLLRRFRKKFHIPKDVNGKELVYLCGNSLGLQPKKTQSYIQEELNEWANLGVEGHTEAKHPWMPYHELLSKSMAKIVGAKPSEVVVMNTLTTNLHLAMVSFYQPTTTKYKIVIESDAFPSDKYAVESQLKFHNLNPKKSLIFWKPRQGEDLCRLEDLETILEEHGNSIALLLIGTTNYYTGQSFPIQKITELGHKHDCIVGFDLAHGVGNIQPNLHESGADFAVWCTYKYLNSGPGSLGGLFVHEKHANNTNLNRFAGWWGHNKKTRFNMRQEFDAIPGAEGWQLSNPPILSMAAIRASLAVFEEAGFENVIEKSKKLTGYLEFLLQNLQDSRIKIITPTNPKERGCQLSIAVKNADKSLHTKLTKTGVISDWREPDVIRVAPAPLYNSFEDAFLMVERLKECLQ